MKTVVLSILMAFMLISPTLAWESGDIINASWGCRDLQQMGILIDISKNTAVPTEKRHAQIVGLFSKHMSDGDCVRYGKQFPETIDEVITAFVDHVGNPIQLISIVTESTYKYVLIIVPTIPKSKKFN